MKLDTQEKIEKVLQAIELLSGYNLADIDRIRQAHQKDGDEVPKNLVLPLAPFELLGMRVSFSSEILATTLGPDRAIVHLKRKD